MNEKLAAALEALLAAVKEETGGADEGAFAESGAAPGLAAARAKVRGAVRTAAQVDRLVASIHAAATDAREAALWVELAGNLFLEAASKLGPGIG